MRKNGSIMNISKNKHQNEKNMIKNNVIGLVCLLVSFDTFAMTLEQKFQLWQKNTQNTEVLKAYQSFLKTKLGKSPNMLELSLNQYILKQPELAKCQKYMFSIPPKSEWGDILETLRFTEYLKKEKILPNYTIISAYRSSQANECTQGAKRSNHLHNGAIDILVQTYKKEMTTKALCDFWHKRGKAFKMGLGTYQIKDYAIFHIDTESHRTWGNNFKSNTSHCLK